MALYRQRAICFSWCLGFFILVFWIQHEPTVAYLISGPKDTVTLLGQEVRFECVSNLSHPIQWSFAATGSNAFWAIYLNGVITKNVSSIYKIENHTNAVLSLVIESVQLGYAGAYRCSDIEQTSHADAQLIVLVSDPICWTNISSSVGVVKENDSVHMSCRVNYSGNWIPQMEWFRNSGQAIHRQFVYTKDSNSVITVTSSFTVQMNPSENGAVFICTTKVCRLSTSSNDSYDCNAVCYHYSWNNTVNVQYGPRNLSIEPRKPIYEVGDQLFCWADGNPVPTYKWVETRTGLLTPGPILTVDKSLASNREYIFECTASNSVAAHQEKVYISVNSKGSSANQISWSPIAGGIMSLFSLVVLGVGISLSLKAYKNDRCRCLNYTVPDVAVHVPANTYDDVEISEQVLEIPEGIVTHNGLPNESVDKSKIFPVYAEVRKESTSRFRIEENNTAQPVLQPKTVVYSESKKKLNQTGNRKSNYSAGAANHHLASESITIHQEANLEGSEPNPLNQPSVYPRAPKVKNYVGEDGTEYMEMNLHGKRPPIQHENVRPPIFNKVDTYASIDHTLRAPPPPSRDFF